MKPLFTRFLLLCVSLLAFSGCAGTQLNSIAVNVMSMEKGPNTYELLLHLRYANGNVIPVGISSTSHSFYLNGKFIGKCKSANPVGLPPELTSDETISIRPENKDIVHEFAGKVCTYRLDSKLIVMSGEDEITINASNSGPLDLTHFKPQP